MILQETSSAALWAEYDRLEGLFWQSAQLWTKTQCSVTQARYSALREHMKLIHAELLSRKFFK